MAQNAAKNDLPPANIQTNEFINTIGSIMIPDVVALSPDASITEAAQKLTEHRIGAVVVVENGKLVGILSERDFVTKIFAQKRELEKLRVSDVMTQKLITARPDYSLGKVLEEMKESHIRHVPVVDAEGHVLGIVSMRDLLTRVEENLRNLVRERTKDLSIDPLTGLYNYRFFNDYLDAEISRSLRRGYLFCLLFIDIDRFKAFNDTQGHSQGNLLLKEFAKILRPEMGEGPKVDFSIRRSDIAVRMGGDEFVLILPETNRAGAMTCAERMRKAVEHQLYHLGSDDIRITVSIGIAEFPSDATKKEDLIERADQALYKAKRTGRNRVISADAG
ncbi:MAG TPA: diguanylate cyclase [Verrucomicrobiae bacterium]|jgi:diguanylate cyclase (GGDEF)-like protein|nr:diguanylate cyclase [Verrucomicrobiae bacterium]